MRNIIIDPLKKFNVPPETIIEACGIIPNWVFNKSLMHIDTLEALKTQYQFPTYPMGGEIDKEGIYHYPEDPDLYPLVKMVRGEDIIYQYDYGIVAVITPDKVTIIRMD